MRNTSLRLTAAVTLAALLGGCSDVGMQGTPPSAGSGLQAQTPSMNVQHASGAALQTQYKQPVTQLNLHPDAIELGLKKLAVSDFGTGAVEILNKGGTETGTISKGLIRPDGDWYDGKGNFYVADYAAVDVQEYAPNGTSPSFTYSAALIDPVDVTADTKGDAFVADYDDGAGSGTVTEYPQNSNKIKYQCEPGGSVVGVAVDKHGDVFASYNSSNGGANIVEYKGGLGSCAGTVLGVTLNYAGGMVLDKKNDLVACDQTAGVVDIIKPPYSKVSSSIKGFSEPFHVGLNKKNKLLFVADVVKAEVFVDEYPSGSSYTTLGPKNGLSDPAGVAVH